MEKQYLRFPKNFLWGAAASAYQVEGNNFNDWSCWEKKNAVKLARSAAKCWSDGQRKQFPETSRQDNYLSRRASDHYRQFEKDFDLAQSLGQNAHRFSVEWSRVEPAMGRFNQEAIAHYQQVVRALRARGLEPFVTLWHFTNPVWISDLGGWENKETVKYFSRYVEKVIAALGADVNFWVTINEPEMYAALAYLKGVWPPQKKSIWRARRVLLNLSRAHREVYQIIHHQFPKARVGAAMNHVYFEGHLSARLADYVWNGYFLNKVKNCQDFIGLNYYFHSRVKGLQYNQNENKEISDLGWEIYPEGIYHLLKKLKKYRKPIYITENGLADAQDKKREKFIKDHLRWVHQAIQEGVDARGYFYWSLLDNFEWEKGFWPRFGLVGINYQTLERTVRPSAFAYAAICRQNGFSL